MYCNRLPESSSSVFINPSSSDDDGSEIIKSTRILWMRQELHFKFFFLNLFIKSLEICEDERRVREKRDTKVTNKYTT